MHFHEDKKLVTGGSLYFKYDSKTIEKWLQLLTPSRANYMLFTLDCGSKDFYTEKYYDTEYLVQGKNSNLKAFKLLLQINHNVI